MATERARQLRAAQTDAERKLSLILTERDLPTRTYERYDGILCVCPRGEVAMNVDWINITLAVIVVVALLAFKTTRTILYEVLRYPLRQSRVEKRDHGIVVNRSKG